MPTFIKGEIVIKYSLAQPSVRPPKRRKMLAGIAIAAGLLIGSVAAPAYAAGSFSVPVTPGGCTGTNFNGNTSGSSGYTQHTNTVCTTNLMVKLRLNRSGVYGPEANSIGGYVSTTLSGSGTIGGNHKLCVRVFGTVNYNCDFSRNT